MRWIALLLLLINAGLLAWQLAGAPGRPQSQPALPEEVGYLALLREPAEAPSAREQAECFSMGPFSDADTAQRAGERLAELGVEPAQRVLTDEETYGYQVILPPFPSREEAAEATRALAEQGIDDYFIITDHSELDNAVSLGLFSEREYALNHQAYLEKIGFEAELRMRTRERERYWQDYRDPAGMVRAEQIEAHVGDGPFQRLPRPCD